MIGSLVMDERLQQLVIERRIHERVDEAAANRLVPVGGLPGWLRVVAQLGAALRGRGRRSGTTLRPAERAIAALRR